MSYTKIFINFIFTASLFLTLSQADDGQNRGQQPPQIAGIPPGFDAVLPKDILKELETLHKNDKLSFDEKRHEFEQIMSRVPTDILAKLPLAPIFNPLPDGWKDKIRAIYANTSIPWTEKHQKIGELIETMPPEIQKVLPSRPPWVPRPAPPPNNGFPPAPPPGFEKVLPKDVYTKLLQIHQDPNVDANEKATKIDSIMRSLNQEILNKLPLPPGFERLPQDKIKEAKVIFTDKNLNYQEKDKKVAEFVKNLPHDQRRLLRPPLPPVLDQLPSETKDKIDEIFEDPMLDHKTRNEKFWTLINSLPSEQKMRVHDGLMKPAPVLVPPPHRRR